MEEIVKQMWKDLSDDARKNIGKQIKENSELAKKLRTVKTPKEFFAEVVKVDAELFRFAPIELKEDRAYVSSLNISSNEKKVDNQSKKEEILKTNQSSTGEDFRNFVPTIEDMFGSNIVNEKINQSKTSSFSAQGNSQVIAYRLGTQKSKVGLSLILLGLALLGISFISLFFGIIRYGAMIVGVTSIISGIIQMSRGKTSEVEANEKNRKNPEAIVEMPNGDGIIIKDVAVSFQYAEIVKVEKLKCEVVKADNGLEIVIGSLSIYTKTSAVKLDNILNVDFVYNYLNSKIGR
jgi:hypothetical protein